MDSMEISEKAPRGPIKRVFSFLWRHKILSSIGGITIVLIALGISWLSQPTEPEYIKEMSKRGDIVQTVEAVGEVISEKDLQLKFPVTGVVAEVSVAEGDTVTAGQEIAKLRNDSLAAQVSSAHASVSVQVAALHELQEGTRPEDILIAEADLDNKRAALQSAQTTYEGAQAKLKSAQSEMDRLQSEADISLSGYLSTSQSTASKEVTATTTALKKTDDVLEKNVLQTIIAVHALSPYETLKLDRSKAEQQLALARIAISNGFSDYRSALTTMEKARAAIAATTDIIDRTYDLVADLPLTGNSFDQTEKEAQKTTLSSASSSAQVSFSAIDTALKNLRDAAASFDTQIAVKESAVAGAKSTMDSSQADILTFESSVRSSEAELAKKRAGARKTEIDGAQARVNQAYADLNRARAQLEDTILRAPFDGVITKVEMKIGEFTGDFENFNKVISMLGASPYRIKMFVAEIDIPKVQLMHTGTIRLDAFPREDIVIRVSEIDPVATSIDGVPKYRVKLDFIDTRKGLRIGMSGDAEIYTDERTDVITIPGRAVLRRDGHEYIRVLHADGVIEEREIVSGLDGADGELEIIDGLDEGEEVIVLIRE